MLRIFHHNFLKKKLRAFTDSGARVSEFKPQLNYLIVVGPLVNYTISISDFSLLNSAYTSL